MTELARRIWARDTAVFVGSDAPAAVQDAIARRLGWLDAPLAASGHAADLATFADAVRRDGLTNVVLLGMGGSSLCAEVFRDAASSGAAARPGCTLSVLDTTDERAIRAAGEALDPVRTLFIVASKSGSTIEVTSLERHFWALVSERLGEAPGRHFIAITDPDTPLERHAADRRYRRAFVNPPDIGGRFSALSLFGLVPASLLGIDIDALGTSAVRMAESCLSDGDANPGVRLGEFMAAEAKAGRDKLTLLLPPAWASFGSWIEQLVAESTGKHGQGVLPVVGEPLGNLREYGPDRCFVSVLDAGAPGLQTRGSSLPRLTRDLERDGRPVFRIEATLADLGAEFFRWEFATSVAGARLEVNPFDEPNVREAKIRTQQQLESRAATGAFRIDPPFERGRGYSRRESRPSQPAPTGRRRYVAILDFLPVDPARASLFERLRAAIRSRTGLAVTHGIGPRYLHSTGQFHKGGPNTGVFVLLTAADASATPVPGADYTFSALKQAQALGDFDALVASGRDVVHYHLEQPTADFSVTLEKLLGQIQ
jgi:glucose-6-phosphate isomerase